MRIRLRRGLDLPIPGAPVHVIEAAARPGSVALLADDHPQVRCTSQVEPGDRVKLGQTLFTARRHPEIRFTSPASGIVSSVQRSELRRLVAVVVEVQGEESIAFPASSAEQLAGLGRETTTARLLESGEWIALRARPVGQIAEPGSTPDAIFVRAMDTNPWAARASAVLDERPDDLRFGLTALARLTDGPVFVCSHPGADLPIADLERVRPVEFDGPHPAGLVGTHIHHLFPVAHGRRVWYAGYQDVLAIGHLFRTGRVNPERVISLSGPVVRRPRLLRTQLGANSEDLVRGELEPVACRIISGSVLSGRRAAGHGSYLGRYHEQICAVAEDRAAPQRAWLVPGLRRGRRVPGWHRLEGWTTALHGRARAMLPLDVFERVVPLRLPLALLLRSLAAGDVEAAEAYGALELEEEDLALCAFLCPSKIDYGTLLRGALTEIEARLE